MQRNLTKNMSNNNTNDNEKQYKGFIFSNKQFVFKIYLLLKPFLQYRYLLKN